jgi:hypothetical protein
MVLTLLLATPLAAAFFLWTHDRRAADATAAVDRVAAGVGRMRDAVAEIGDAQQGYVAPGQIDEPWFERTTARMALLRNEVAAMRFHVRSTAASAALDAFSASIDALEAADARSRDNLILGQDLMAADVIFSDGRNILDAMMVRLREIVQAEDRVSADTLGGLARARWAAVGVLAFVSLVVLALTLRAPSEAPGMPEVPPMLAAASETTASYARTRSTHDMDLAAAASLCTDLSRVTDTAALSHLVGRAADILDASGVTLWMSAGEQLFPVFGHGYPAEELARFGPIARSAENVAAAAWRSGRLSAIAGSATRPGGLVAPMFGPDGCIGVLALEVRHGREQDPDVQAVASMVAAQLATVVAAWPAGSGAPTAKTA